jgi:hypothetical protein
MKRAKTRAERKTSKRPSGKASRKAVDLAAVQTEIGNLVGNAAVEMVETTIGEANKGHYAAMKFLFELVGLYPAQAREEEIPVEDGLAKMLFKRLGMPAESVLDPEVTKDCEPPLAAASDAVE